jgi:hypothetical protein
LGNHDFFERLVSEVAPFFARCRKFNLARRPISGVKILEALKLRKQAFSGLYTTGKTKIDIAQTRCL